MRSPLMLLMLFVFLAGVPSMAESDGNQSSAPVRLISLPPIQPLQHVSLALQGPRGLSYPFTCSIVIPPSLKPWLKFSCATLSFSGVVPAKVERGAYKIPLLLSDNDGYSASFGLDLSVGTITMVRLESPEGAAVKQPGPPPPLPETHENSDINVVSVRASDSSPEVPKAQFVRTRRAVVEKPGGQPGALSGEPNKPAVAEANAATSTSSGGAAAAPAGGSAANPPAKPPPTISGPVRVGDNPVHGSAVASANNTTVSVQLERKRSGDGDFSPVLDPVTTNAAGLWSVSYEVQDGDVLRAVQSSTTADAVSTPNSADVAVESATNEREHTTFVGGTLLSQTGSNFSQQNLFLAFNTDRALYVPGWYRGVTKLCAENGLTELPATRELTQQERDAFTAAHNGHAPADQAERHPCLPTRHPGLNGFFEARLTAIPVNVSTTPMTTTTATTSATAQSLLGNRSRPKAADATDTSTAKPDPSSFISSQKSARVIVGGYMPVMFGKVPTLGAHAHMQTSTFYVAPIVRAGFDTLTDSTLQVASSSQGGTDTSGAVTTTPTATLSKLGSTAQLNRLYSFGTGGVRFGTATIGPGSLDTDHYLDITFGRFSNLESLFCPTKGGCLAACPAGTTAVAGNCTCPATVDPANPCVASKQALDPTQEFRARIPRISIEGFFRIPTTGFIVGISANIGQNSILAPKYGDPNNRAVDDLRFLFGYKIDINKLVQNFPQVF